MLLKHPQFCIQSASAASIEGAAWLMQIVARQFAVRQARVRISARHPRGSHLPSGSNEDNKSGTLLVVYKNIVYDQFDLSEQ